MLLVRTDDLVVRLTGAQAYKNGIAFAVNALCRDPSALPGGLLHTLAGGMWSPDPDSDGNQFLFGLHFSDGRSVTNVRIGELRPRAEPYPDAPILCPAGGSGSSNGGNATLEFFLNPLPPPGVLTVYAAWPAMDIAEVRRELDATAIVEAAARAVVLWPEVPDHDLPPEPPRPPLQVSPGGWFDSVLRRSEPSYLSAWDEPPEGPARPS